MEQTLAGPGAARRQWLLNPSNSCEGTNYNVSMNNYGIARVMLLVFSLGFFSKEFLPCARWRRERQPRSHCAGGLEAWREDVE